MVLIIASAARRLGDPRGTAVRGAACPRRSRADTRQPAADSRLRRFRSLANCPGSACHSPSYSIASLQLRIGEVDPRDEPFIVEDAELRDGRRQSARPQRSRSRVSCGDSAARRRVRPRVAPARCPGIAGVPRAAALTSSSRTMPATHSRSSRTTASSTPTPPDQVDRGVARGLVTTATGPVGPVPRLARRTDADATPGPGATAARRDQHLHRVVGRRDIRPPQQRRRA